MTIKPLAERCREMAQDVEAIARYQHSSGLRPECVPVDRELLEGIARIGREAATELEWYQAELSWMLTLLHWLSGIEGLRR
jgi:hypothetical protein